MFKRFLLKKLKN